MQGIIYPPNDIYFDLTVGDRIEAGDEFDLNALQYGGPKWSEVTWHEIGMNVERNGCYRRKRISDSEFQRLYFQLHAIKENFKVDRKFNHTKFYVVDLLEIFGNRRFDIGFWPGLFCLQLKWWDFSTSSCKRLLEWGAEGHNWDRLHPNDADKELSAEEVLKRFYSEVAYCSDRMGLDRLFRCHWLYNLYMQKVRG